MVIFGIFYAKKVKKQEILLSLHQNAGRLFYSPKNEHFSQKTHFIGKNVFLEIEAHFFGNKSHIRENCVNGSVATKQNELLVLYSNGIEKAYRLSIE